MSRRKYSKKANGRGDVYGYDTAGQLASVKYDAETPDIVPANAQRTVIYAHDAAGNRTGITDTVAGEVTPFSLSYVSNINNQYTSVGFSTLGYDGRGNLASYSENGPSSTRRLNCSYDSENRLLSATNNFDSTGLTQAYDPLGRCVKRVENGVTTYFVHDQSWHLLSEYDASGVQKTRYVGGPITDEIISRTDAGGATFYYHTDGLGSVTGLTNSNGQLVETYSYDIYGNPTIKDAQGQKRWTSALGNRFLFTGREYLYSLGVYDYRARIYDPYLGRFWQPDPIGHSGDGSNIYRYCGNDPVNNTDPSGLQSIGGGGILYLPPLYVIANYTGSMSNWTAQQLLGYARLTPYPFSNLAGWGYKLGGGASMHEEARKAEFKEQSKWRKVEGFIGDAMTANWGATPDWVVTAGEAAGATLDGWIPGDPIGNAGGYDDTKWEYDFSNGCGAVACNASLAALTLGASLNGGASSVFYSGGSKALSAARGAGGVMLEKTAGGRLLNYVESKSVQYLGKRLPDVIWKQASGIYAQNAHGSVQVFLRSPNPKSIWNTVERPILEAKRYVTLLYK